MEFKRSVYLDTTVPSAMFDGRAAERQELTASFFETAATQYRLNISNLVLDEIARTPGEVLRGQLLELVAPMEILELKPEVVELARLYVQEGVVPERYKDDAIHLAIAAVHEVAIVASWNFRHMVKLKTRNLVNLIHAKHGLIAVDIVSPAQL